MWWENIKKGRTKERCARSAGQRPWTPFPFLFFFLLVISQAICPFSLLLIYVWPENNKEEKEKTVSSMRTICGPNNDFSSSFLWLTARILLAALTSLCQINHRWALLPSSSIDGWSGSCTHTRRHCSLLPFLWRLSGCAGTHKEGSDHSIFMLRPPYSLSLCINEDVGACIRLALRAWSLLTALVDQERTVWSRITFPGPHAVNKKRIACGGRSLILGVAHYSLIF